MVNLDRVEMLRTSERGSRTFALSAEVITPTPFDVQKRQQTKAVRDQISMFTYSEDDEEEECREESTSKETNDAKQPQEESRETAPVANKKKEVSYSVGDILKFFSHPALRLFLFLFKT